MKEETKKIQEAGTQKEHPVCGRESPAHSCGSLDPRKAGGCWTTLGLTPPHRETVFGVGMEITVSLEILERFDYNYKTIKKMQGSD